MATASEMNTELVVVMSSIGFYDGDTYFKSSECIESLKDLIRFLRREDETCNIRRQIGYSKVLQKDLLPILMCYADDAEIVDIVIRLMVNLTSPADICFNKKPDEAEEAVGRQVVSNTYQTKYLEVIGYLQAYKEAFTEKKVMAAIGAQLGKILQMEWEERGEDELTLFERILLLIRNILHVPASLEEEKRTDDDASLHDQVLWNMHVNGIDDLMIYITSAPDESRWIMHAIEIVQLMLREQNPELLGRTSAQRNAIEKAEDTQALLEAKEKENLCKHEAMKRRGTTRHARFGGSFWVTNMKGVGNKNTLVQHQHVADVDDITFDQKKFKARVSKKQQAAKETNVERKSTLNIRLFLKEFCDKFLEHSYNPLMKAVKANVVAKRAQENDDSYYLWCLRFHMAFNRCHLFKVELVSETLNMDAFHYILRQINNYYNNFFINKRGGWHPWQKRLHLSIQAYKELLTYLTCMDKSSDNVLKDASSVIKNNVFYHEEYRSIFLLLLRHFEPNKQTKKYLCDLVDTFHVFLKLLEMFCGGKQTLLVKTKKKVARKRRKIKAKPAIQTFTDEQLEQLWENELAPSLSEIMQGHEFLPDNIESPFDVASDVPVDEQGQNAMIRIQDNLRNGKCQEAVALLRLSRECWPTEEKFGSENISSEEEFMIIRNLLFMKLDRTVFMYEQQSDEEAREENEVEEEEEEEEAVSVRSVEREFHLQHFLTALASPQIIIPYNILLKSFKTNSSSTNHAIAKMMHRVAHDLKFPEMFFQLSLFLTFQDILNHEILFKELATFSKYILAKFFVMVKERPKIFVELLFWKGSGDCYQISEREDTGKRKGSDAGKGREKWTFEDEEELKTLYDQFKESDDVVGDILKNINNTDRTRRQISNKLVRLKVVENIKQLPKPPRRQPASEWSTEQNEEIHRLYDEFKETHDPLSNIMNALSFSKSKQAVKNQLLATGKVSDRKDLRKKRKRTKRNALDQFMGNDEQQDSTSESDNEANDEVDTRNSLTDPDDEEAFDRFIGSQQRGDSDGDIDSNPHLSFHELAKNVTESGYIQQIIWLQTRLRRAAEGREEESDWYPVPLLTMTEDDENALHDRSFKQLLKVIGLKPPANHQESFWRIPEELSPTTLRKYADDLDVTAFHCNAKSNSCNVEKKRKKKKKSYAILDSDSESGDNLYIEETALSITAQLSDDDTNLPLSKQRSLESIEIDKEVTSNDGHTASSHLENENLETRHDDKNKGNSHKGKKRFLFHSDSENEHGEDGVQENGAKGIKRKKVLPNVLSEDESDDASLPNGDVVHQKGESDVKITFSKQLESSEEDSANRSALDFSLRLSEEEEGNQT